MQKLGEAEDVAEMEKAGAQCRGAVRCWAGPCGSTRVAGSKETVCVTGQAQESREKPQASMGCTIQG